MTEDPQALWLELYKSTQAQEKNLKELLHHKGVQSVTSARDRLREDYERLILTDIVLAHSKEIESALWKHVFYVVIDGYRRKLAMLSRGGGGRGNEGGRGGNRDNGRSRPHGTRGNKPAVPSVEYRKVSTKFRAFIQEATGFYHRLIQNLASCYDLNESGHSMHAVPIGDKRPLSDITDAARDSATSSCHKCYVYLGDLSRYRQTFNDSFKKNWSAARDYYNEARNMLPSSGNPYNQLAVVATFTPNNFLALYFYYRSLAVSLPFMTARNNIKVLIQKIASDPEKGKKFVKDERYTDRQAINSKDSAQLDDFLLRFILLHGALFMRSAEEVDHDVMGDTLERLFVARLLEPDLLLKIQIINMASLYTMTYIPLQDDNSAAYPQQEIESERKALQLILTCFATVLQHATTELENHRNGDHKKNGRPIDFLPSNVHRSMPTLRLSLKWMQVNIHHVKRLSEGFSDAETENRFHLRQIWEDLSTFLNLLVQAFPYTEGAIFCRDVLKEDDELRGFAALKRTIDERPLSIIPPSRISPKAEMQMRVGDMFHDALSLAKMDWPEFYGKVIEDEDDMQTVRFSVERDEDGDSTASAVQSNLKDSAEEDYDEEVDDGEDGAREDEDREESDYERKEEDEDMNPFHIRRTSVSKVQNTHRDQDIDQRQAVAALLSDDDNDLSLIVGQDDDEEDDEEDDAEEVVLFKGRSSTIGGKPTPKPAHLKTSTGVIGAGRRASMSPTGSNQSSPGLDMSGSSSKFGSPGEMRMNPSPTVDSLFGRFQFGVADDWRHSINSLRTSRTTDGINGSTTWGGLSSSALGNGMISPASYEPRDANALAGFTSIPTQGLSGISLPTSPMAASPSGFSDDPVFQQYQKQPRHVPQVRPKYQYQPQASQQPQHRYSQRDRNGSPQAMGDGDWR
ncbi:hypothetical protein K457DRAFT_526163 [Linnemannia elongata AG-77]|uniref:DNA/RNA-binding domain-containing protein n=1 Tax=Linnemannia elongata AG-77 TaxID=1314771 RepID=A0A197JXF1_9FUNG|nr:hypothetical protein K457DRAFT_526163 [Linnemannia elongata AG-77]